MKILRFMVAGKLFLKALFLTINLLVFCDVFAKETQELKVHYAGDRNGSGSVSLNLTNNGDFFSISYSDYSGYVSANVELNSDQALKIKMIRLNDNAICIGTSYVKDMPFSMFNKNRKWIYSVDLDFKRCKSEWRELIKEARGGYLKFFVVCIESGTNFEKRYSFKVSSANLSSLVNILELLT
ncbi:hypothetical protein baBA2_000963 (plasmid) [Borrelia anserina]|nr:hypothetical protein [Borrelia anserina]UPA07333.1 hypothetical protein baBA2_000963 [Borrelia anserina]